MNITQTIVRIVHITIDVTANSKHGTLNCGGKQKYFVFEHSKINHDCITHHYEHNKSNYKSKTAKSDSHKLNSRYQTTTFDYDS